MLRAVVGEVVHAGVDRHPYEKRRQQERTEPAEHADRPDEHNPEHHRLPAPIAASMFSLLYSRITTSANRSRSSARVEAAKSSKAAARLFTLCFGKCHLATNSRAASSAAADGAKSIIAVPSAGSQCQGRSPWRAATASPRNSA